TITWSDTGSGTTFASLGLSLNVNSGVVSGTPLSTVAAGSYQIRVAATNGIVTSVRNVNLLIEPLPIAALGFTGAAFVGIAHSVTLQGIGGTGPYTFPLAPSLVIS